MQYIDKLLQKDGLLRLCWLGNDGWLIGHGGHLIATDLDLCLAERILPPYAHWEALGAALSHLFITHAHTDHFNPETVQRLMAGGACTLVLPESCREAAEAFGADTNRVCYATPGQAVPGMPDWLGARAMRAVHGHMLGSVFVDANLQDCGYVFTLGGMRLVQPGDSLLLEEHFSLSDVDVLFISPTEHNMGVTQSRQLIEAIQPGHIFAQHFGTYLEREENAFWTHGYQAELGASLPPAMRARYQIPAYEAVYELDPTKGAIDHA